MKSSHRAELRKQYRDRPRRAGVFVVRNTANGKLLLGSSLNLHGPLGKHRFMLEVGSHPNRAMQDDWRQYGPGAFEFAIVEELEPKDDPNLPRDDDLWLLEQIWLEKTLPFGERGYNLDPKKIRE